ncbi:MAG: hypothetical protein B7Z19_06920, partial [Polynucleobacter sp. 32-46-5]
HKEQVGLIMISIAYGNFLLKENYPKVDKFIKKFIQISDTYFKKYSIEFLSIDSLTTTEFIRVTKNSCMIKNLIKSEKRSIELIIFEEKKGSFPENLIFYILIIIIKEKESSWEKYELRQWKRARAESNVSVVITLIKNDDVLYLAIPLSTIIAITQGK